MRTVWTIVGVLVILIIIFAVYNAGMKKSVVVPVQMAMATPTPVNPKTNNTITRDVIVEQPVQPIIIVTNGFNCNDVTYQTNLRTLYDAYLVSRVAWNAAIVSNTNVAQARADMNAAYNTFWQERRKCYHS